MGMYNEVFKTCPHCNGRGYMQIYQIVLLETKNRGEDWEIVRDSFFKSEVKEGESFFASSSTNLTFDFKHLFLFLISSNVFAHYSR